MALQAQGSQLRQAPAAYIAPLGAGMNRHALRLARELRQQGVSVDVGDESFRLRRSFEVAEKLGAKYALLVGENEVLSGKFAVKNLASGEQVTVSRAELAQKLAQK
jgi:histidyl-tRNA synthetase